MPDGTIKVTPRTLSDGIDINRLALALTELAHQLPDSQRVQLALEGARLLAEATEEVNRTSAEGAA